MPQRPSGDSRLLSGRRLALLRLRYAVSAWRGGARSDWPTQPLVGGAKTCAYSSEIPSNPFDPCGFLGRIFKDGALGLTMMGEVCMTTTSSEDDDVNSIHDDASPFAAMLKAIKVGRIM